MMFIIAWILGGLFVAVFYNMVRYCEECCVKVKDLLIGLLLGTSGLFGAVVIILVILCYFSANAVCKLMNKKVFGKGWQ